MIRLRPSGADEVLIKRVRDWYEPGPGVFIEPQSLFSPAQLFTGTTTGAWYDPSDINLTWRRNLLTYSEQFDNAAWSKFRSTVSVNAAVAPDGTMSADKIVATNVLGSHGLGQAVGALPTTVSVYLKAGEYSFAAIGFNNVTPSVLTDSVFNITTGQIVSIGSDVASYSVTDVGNGWFRYSCQPSATATFSQMRVAVMADSTTISYTGDGTSGIYIWGAQLELGSTATPYQRITDGIQDYLQYQAQPVLYQDAAGTTPVTAVEQPVGLMLDKSKGLVLGPELVTNGGFSSNLSSWAQSTANYWTWVNGRAYHANSANYNELSQTFAVISRPVRIEFDYECLTASNTAQWFYTNAAGIVKSFDSAGIPRLQNGVGKMIYTAIDGIQKIGFSRYVQAEFYIDNISVRELPGNHAFNASGNSANFPVLSARYNLLTKTEDFTAGGPWTLGTGVSVSNQKTITFTSGGATEFVRQLYSFVSGITYTILIRAKSVSGNTTMSVDLDNAQGVTDMILTTEFQVFQRQITPSAARAWMDIQLGGGGVVQIDYIDLRVSNDALNQPAYQRVNTSTDYDTVGFKPYLRFNGTNQWLQTNSIDFTYGDKMFVSAGVRKLSDAAQGVLLESSTSVFANAGSFWITAPDANASTTIQWRAGGTANDAVTSNSNASPFTAVVTGLSNISQPLLTQRVNGVQKTATGTQGTGNFGNYALFVGARAGTSLWFNGRLYQMVVAGKQASASEISSTETYINQKTGAWS